MLYFFWLLILILEGLDDLWNSCCSSHRQQLNMRMITFLAIVECAVNSYPDTLTHGLSRIVVVPFPVPIVHAWTPAPKIECFGTPRVRLRAPAFCVRGIVRWIFFVTHSVVPPVGTVPGQGSMYPSCLYRTHTCT